VSSILPLLALSSRPTSRSGQTPSPLPGPTTFPCSSALKPSGAGPPPSPNWALTDWPTLDSSLKATTTTPPPHIPTSRSLDLWFNINLDKKTAQQVLHTPVKRITYWFKAWGTELLSELRKAYNSGLWSSKWDQFDSSLLASARSARSPYFKAIKRAKRAHWFSFFAAATPQSVLTAKRFAVGRPPPSFPELPGASTPLELNKALLDYFIPEEPTKSFNTILLLFKHCPALAADKVGRALARSSPLSAPGPDKTPNSAWKWIHYVAPHLVHTLLQPLIAYTFHPPAIKTPEGIIFDKSGKPAYDSPASFLVIVLLQTFSKILEMIMNSRLSCVARSLGLLNPHQCGLQAGLSALDATSALSHEITTLQMAQRKVSTLFLDLKCGLNNVNPATLCHMLRAKGVNPYLVSWTRSFLSGRSCLVLYQGSPKIFTPMSVGTAQGSRVSPLLFIIYVSRLHCTIPHRLTLSYFDNLGLTASSASYRRNIHILQRQYARLKARGSSLGVGFSVPKTELIHWRTNRERGPISHALIHLDGSVFPTKDEVS